MDFKIFVSNVQFFLTLFENQDDFSQKTYHFSYNLIYLHIFLSSYLVQVNFQKKLKIFPFF